MGTGNDTTTSTSTVIRGGTVVDGTGAPGRRADVLIADGRVQEIGTGLTGDQTYDADGAVVAPGFVDIHTHYDAQVFWDPALTPSCFHGVTTVVAGNCGFSIAPLHERDRDHLVKTMQQVEDMDPDTLLEGVSWDFESFPDYLASVERQRPLLNFGAFIGHTPLRLYAMGAEASQRLATDDEVATMRRLVVEAMDAGAMGFASSYGIAHRDGNGDPIPSRLAGRDEIVALTSVLAEVGRGVFAINGGEGLSFREVYELQPEVGVPITFTALLTAANGAHLKGLEIHRRGMQAGTQVFPQVSCRPLTFSMTLADPFSLNTNTHFAALIGKPISTRREAFADPAWRAKVEAEWDGMRGGFRPRFETYLIMESAAHPELVGRNLVDVAAERGGDPFHVLLDLALDEPEVALRVKAVVANDDEAGVEILLQEPGCVLGLSDAGAHVGQLCDAPLPTDLLGNWVRGREVLSLEAAVHKLTGEPAALFGLRDRGVLRPGAHADVTIFDPATVDPGPLRRVADFPAGGERFTADQVTGVRRVYVNGVVAVDDGRVAVEAAEARPGQLVRPG